MAGRKPARPRCPRWLRPATCGCLIAELCPWVGELIDEAAGFPTAAHDDDVDAMTQALNRLVLQPLLAGDLVVSAEDLDEEMAEYAGISPY